MNVIIKNLEAPSHSRIMCITTLTEDDTLEMLRLKVHLKLLARGSNVPRSFVDFNYLRYINAGKSMDFDWKPLRYYGVGPDSYITMMYKFRHETAQDSWRCRLRKRARETE